MAIPVARLHLAMAHAALPGLLPTPPKSAMTSPPPCLPILPKKSPSKAKPGRADAAERWDAHKTKPACPSSSSSSSSSGSSQRSPGSTSSSPGRASSCDKWDSNKKCPSSTSPSSSASSHQRRESGGGSRAPSGEKSGSSKGPVSRAASAERWDLHKKPRSSQVHGDGGMGRSDGKETNKLPQAVYAGPGFTASPEPCMLPIPAPFMVRAR